MDILIVVLEIILFPFLFAFFIYVIFLIHGHIQYKKWKNKPLTEKENKILKLLSKTNLMVKNSVDSGQEDFVNKLIILKRDRKILNIRRFKSKVDTVNSLSDNITNFCREHWGIEINRDKDPEVISNFIKEQPKQIEIISYDTIIIQNYEDNSEDYKDIINIIIKANKTKDCKLLLFNSMTPEETKNSKAFKQLVENITNKDDWEIIE
ncbi:hypothetical protein [Mycoplasma sp. Mirounga ES2805-ORL]|uniref:hypothetical protein n=1 Tax=Mycoplasma sp. Mirounga ES2805-ORL TaxID=754514 RepID=UPI00197C258B|nr:hypothetical protein [Mycoplasma sp. Mirounga ES2805-ORL]QSF13662.1 hypothetical protein JXZ90_03275 [Mycoplasma sp. Mirounga ES2805-ORL]